MKSIIKNKQLEPLPKSLEEILKTFSNSSELDVWQGMIDEVVPRLIERTVHTEFFSTSEIIEIKNYYARQPEYVIEAIQTLCNLGISNLYGGFKSEITMEYLDNTLRILNLLNVPLPPFKLVEQFSIKIVGEWGSLIDIDSFNYGDLI
ncbi:hypothetical protein ACLI1A_13200 [Flavobacterium sp. RHBU_3]|uniref:hypothetical protein n=1 Tax=Flavobacterium sp. RHBU_3 TaxID=3391184 RepID=UPI003984CFC6